MLVMVGCATILLEAMAGNTIHCNSLATLCDVFLPIEQCQPRPSFIPIPTLNTSSPHSIAHCACSRIHYNTFSLRAPCNSLATTTVGHNHDYGQDHDVGKPESGNRHDQFPNQQRRASHHPSTASTLMRDGPQTQFSSRPE